MLLPIERNKNVTTDPQYNTEFLTPQPSAQDVERILAENNMSIEDLKRDVERQERRTSLKAMVASPTKLEQEYDR